MMHTPYSVLPRPETGMNNARLGLYLFLAAEVMFFGALFSSFAFLSAAGPDWKANAAALSSGIALVQCAALVAAWIAAKMSLRMLRTGEFEWHWLAGTISAACAAIFVATVLIQLTELTDNNLYPRSNTFLALYYVFSVVCGLHVALLSLWSLVHLTAGRFMQLRNPGLHRNQVECLSTFAGFNALVWIVVTALFRG
jgi:cytochrome c oxidase subunit 3